MTPEGTPGETPQGPGPRSGRSAGEAREPPGGDGSGGIDLRGLIGSPPDRLLSRLDPAADRRVRGERWLRFETPELSVRIRCRASATGGAGAADRVGSWTVRFRGPGPATLREAAGRVGLWPAVSPDARPKAARSLIRRPLPAADGDRVHSITASVREGRIVSLTAFDESPDWR